MLETIRGVDPEQVPVKHAMSPSPYVVKRNTPVAVAARQLWRNNGGSAIVVEGGQVVGIFTPTDALQALVEVLTKTPIRHEVPDARKG